MNLNSAQRLQYLCTKTPADDRIGRSAPAVDVSQLGISGPAFEMPDTAPSAGAPASVAHVKRWSAPEQPERPIVEPAGRTIRRVPAPAEEPIDASSQPAPQPAGSIGRRFVLAGRAVFTLQGKDSRYTYRVNHVEASDRGPERWFVALLTGPDNTADYTYVGMLDASSGQLVLTKKSTYRADSQPVKAFNWVMRYLWTDRALPEPARIFHMGRCGRCGRALTVPSSIESGLGPECAGKLGE